MAILLTGGTGFLGGTIITEIIENQQEWNINPKNLRVLVRGTSNIDRLKKLTIPMVVGDLGDPESLKKAVQGVETIIHTAAVVLDQSPEHLLYKYNVEGTKALVDAFVNEKNHKKFVYVSTWGVYGYKVKPKPMKENQPFEPTSEYHNSKVQAEKILWDYHQDYGIPVTVARKPMIMGPGDTLTTPRVIQAFFDNKVVRIGKGDNLFSGIHVRDAARSILAMATKKEANGEAYNVKSFDISQKEYWNTHAEAINYPKITTSYPKSVAMIYAFFKEIMAKIKGEGKSTITRHRVRRYGNTRVLDDSKIRKQLGWEPIHTDGKKVIKQAVKWLEENDFIDYQKKEVKIVRKWEAHFGRNNDDLEPNIK
ncbi:MAG: NAD-dependent epimerase/dehydratase family protein [Candidatus Heimdallarchaeota archaeon]|nr:NAD-dependent epimerase/dehydratase family protein [Candidatus Heimdallarchaeota archaeon]